MDVLRSNGAWQETIESVRRREGSLDKAMRSLVIRTVAICLVYILYKAAQGLDNSELCGHRGALAGRSS